MPLHSHFPTGPRARPEAVLRGDRWRITILTEGLVRLEWSPDGEFEDRASTLALFRDQPVPTFSVVESAAAVEITTARFHLSYDRGPFSSSGLSLQVRGNVSSYHSVWRFGEPAQDLGGTARTLDGVDGRTPLEPGIVSRGGFGVLDDSGSFVFDDDGWVASRCPGRLDLYVFAYGLDHQAGIDAFHALSGPQPLLPRWALGNWWSRYHPYSAAEYEALLDRFAAEGLPFSVAVLDMDWHRVDDVDPVFGSGWTGYSWNRDLFPDPPAFLAELHRRGLRVTLNEHPADGVRAFEDAYPAMAAALGRDTADGRPIGFDVTDRAFLEAYFDVLHRGLEGDGVDFWWIDWQSGRRSRIPGVDPLWVLNHFHYLYSGRSLDPDHKLDPGGSPEAHQGPGPDRAARRPLTFSRYAGPGSHRYPVGFSGDTAISWASLEFQPEFTATAANIGYGWWSHDIGGHFWGSRDDDLAVRWLQYGVFSPILRLHSSLNPFLVKEPWQFPPEAARAMGDALRFRNRLVPYLHSMNHRAAKRARPLVRPMYHLHPTVDAAYRVPTEFAFGTELVVAPITSPVDPVTLLGSTRAWLPPGRWVDLFTTTVYDGDRELELHRDATSIPVLVRAGGIVPLAATADQDAAGNPGLLELVVVPGADGSFDLVEDDGTGSTPDTVPTATTTITWEQATGTLTIGPAVRTGPGAAIVASRRTWTVTLLGIEPTELDPGAAATATVPAPGRVQTTVTDVATDTATAVVLGGGLQPRTSDRARRLFDLLNHAQFGYSEKAAVWLVLTAGEPAAALAELAAHHLPGALFPALAELLTAR